MISVHIKKITNKTLYLNVDWLWREHGEMVPKETMLPEPVGERNIVFEYMYRPYTCIQSLLYNISYNTETANIKL